MNSNVKRRTIMIFPSFKNINLIDEIRRKYDPLAKHVKPHITLVFTFQSDLTSINLKAHLEKVLKEMSPFKLTLQQVTKIDNALGKYLFLNVKEGNENIKNLSKKLYTGILAPYKPHWLNEETFMPHMTIGNFSSSEDLNKAFEATKLLKDSFNTVVDKISVEIIDDNEYSIIEMEIELST